MAERDGGFLSRWSRLKRAEQEPKPAAPAVQQADLAAPQVTEETGESPAETPDPSKDLPAIETLDRSSDYTVFLRAGVPPELRKQALAKLWRSDPVFANLDGLLEYGEDYSLPFKRAGIVATAYRVGKGMMDAALDDEKPSVPPSAEEAKPPEPSAAEREDADSAEAKDTPARRAAGERQEDDTA